MCVCGAQECELRGAERRGDLPGARDGPLSRVQYRLPSTSDVSIPGAGPTGLKGASVEEEGWERVSVSLTDRTGENLKL